MSNPLFIHLAFKDVDTAFQNCLSNDRFKASKLLTDTKRDLVAFADFVNKRANHVYGKIRLTVIGADATVPNEPEALFISCINTEEKVVKSVRYWRYQLEETLRYHWEAFWPDHLKANYDQLMKLNLQEFGTTVTAVKEAYEILLKVQTFHPWLHALAKGKSKRLPLKKDLMSIQKEDQTGIKKVGVLEWLFTQNSAGFRWEEVDPYLSGVQFYHMFRLMLNELKLSLGSMNISYYNDALAYVVLVEILKDAHIGNYDAQRFVDYFSEENFTNSHDIKLMLYQMQSKGFHLEALRKVAQQLAQKYWSADQDDEGEEEAVTTSDQFFVEDTKPETSWFAF